jgi:hypothetical protein
MDNLITSVIAIALLGAVTLMGAYYGGDVIMNWQAKIEASQIVADAQRIADGWREYTRANNGNPALSDYCWGDGSSDLGGVYLSRMPAPPEGAVDSTVTFYFPASVKSYDINGSTTLTGPAYSPADSVALLLKSPNVCMAIANQAGYSTATAKATSMSGDLSATTTRRPYDCLYLDADTSGGPSDGDTMLFIYRVFDQNNFSYAARLACS